MPSRLALPVAYIFLTFELWCSGKVPPGPASEARLRYLFEHFVLDTDRRELRRDGEVVHTTPQVFDFLKYLIEHRDRVLTKDDFFAAVWNGRIVSELALTTRLNAARRAIGDNGQAQRLIRTLPRKGYRFVGAVHPETTNIPKKPIELARV